jgi:diaminopimelate decarboxylase
MKDKLPRLFLFPQTAGVSSSDHHNIGGCDTVELTATFGTPLYVFDEEGVGLNVVSDGEISFTKPATFTPQRVSISMAIIRAGKKSGL